MSIVEKFQRYVAVMNYNQKGKRDVKMSPLRVTEDEERTIREMADKYTNGNVADWMRIACLKYNPVGQDWTL
jgi:hypothetical protein